MIPRKKRSSVWCHFNEVKSRDNKSTVQCLHCTQLLSIHAGSIGNMGRHLKRKHPDIPFGDREEQNVIYEYVVADDSSSVSGDGDEAKRARTKSPPTIIRSARSSISERPEKREKLNKKTLIERLTEDKLKLTILQTKVAEKELEERNMRLQLIQAEVIHKTQMYDLEKEEMLLRIEVLKDSLAKSQKCPETLPDLE